MFNALKTKIKTISSSLYLEMYVNKEKYSQQLFFG